MTINKFFHKHPSRMVVRDNLFRRIAKDPFVDWSGILILSFITALWLIVLGLFTYIDMNRQLSDQVGASAPAGAASLNAKLLDQVIANFDSRASDQKDILKGYSGPSDPSI